MRKILAALLLAAALPVSAQTIQVHAHRGGRAARPENTLPAFHYAIENQVDAIELDLAVTRDNVLVVSHSPYLTQPHYDDPRMNAVLANERHCAGPELPPGTLIHSLTLAQLRQYDCGATTLAAFTNKSPSPTPTSPPSTRSSPSLPRAPSTSTSRPRSSPPTPRSPPRPKPSSR